MKHTWMKTFIIILWVVFAVLLGLAVAPFASMSGIQQPALSPWVAIPLIIGTILLSAIFFLKMLKKPKFNVELLFVIVTGIIMMDTTTRFFLWFLPWWMILTYGALGTLFFGEIMLWLINKMQISWYNTIRYAPWSNLLFLTSISFAAVSLSSNMAPLTALILLGLVAIYDAIMVWKLKKMQELAEGLLKRRVLIGIAVPYDDVVEKFAMLGGGDVFFIIFVATSFYKTSVMTMLIMAAMMTLSIVLLFFFSSKNKSYPAIPYIFAAAMVGLLISWVVV